MRSDGPVQSWLRLEGKIAPEILRAPKTGGDPQNERDWTPVHERSVHYLEQYVVGKPWANHLALIVAVLSARHYDTHTVESALNTLHVRFAALFAALHLETMDAWDAEPSMIAYLKWEVLPDDTQDMRTRFCDLYNRGAKQVKSWIETLPDAVQPIYQRFLLPQIHPMAVSGLMKRGEVQRQAQQVRKAETDAIISRFVAIRTEAHFRYNRLVRLRQAYHKALDVWHETQQRDPFALLPLSFSYEEGGDPSRGLPSVERLHFRMWDRRSFVLAHKQSYPTSALEKVEQGRKGFAEAHNTVFVEFVKAERLLDDAVPEGFWFEELFTRGVMGAGPFSGSPEEVAAKQDWLRTWGYGTEDNEERVRPFHAKMRGLLTWTRRDGQFMSKAQAVAEGTLLPLDPLYAAATFGLLAIDLFTTTGMRVNEAMQVRLTQDCFVRLQMQAPPGAKDQSPRVRFAFRLIPKGERTNTPQDYFMGEETKRLLVKVARMLAEHYHLEAGASLPAVPFHPLHPRAHRFGTAPYLFQYGNQHVSDQSITACMRFLLHGMVFRTRDGDQVTVKPHLLRHAFATYAVQVEKIPLDIVGAMLKQKNLDVTAYYSQVTPGMIADAHDRFLAGFAAQINVGEAVQRSPEELQRLVEEAQGKAGTFAEVMGGQCVMHGFCGAKFVCIGCPGKVPDPAKRAQVEKHMEWAEKQVQYATEEGLYPEAERMKQVVRDCATELREMDQIEAYRKDEQRVPLITIAPIKQRA
jgi:integrase